MDLAAPLNEQLQRHHPAAWRCLSDVGRRLYFPVDIPAQSAEARGCRLNATIGEVTDGRGRPIPLPAIADHLVGVPEREAFLYAAQGGEPRLRAAWGARLDRPGVPHTLPVVCCGITHALSVAAELFADADTDVILPRPAWGNYRMIFGVHRGSRLRTWPAASRGGLDLGGIEAALSQVQGRALLVLNFPGNPSGYTPTLAEARALVELLRDQPGPLVVLLDDAYQDMVWEEGHVRDSLFHALATADPERLVAVKADGATKELFFFGGRVGFLTFGASGPAGDALVEKARGALRMSVSAAPSLSQALVRRALDHPAFAEQQAAVRAELARRYRALKVAVEEEELVTFPFNSGIFALVPVSGDADALRRSLIAEEGVGLVAFRDFGALRLAYGSMAAEDLPTLVRALRARI